VVGFVFGAFGGWFRGSRHNPYEQSIAARVDGKQEKQLLILPTLKGFWALGMPWHSYKQAR